MKKVSVIFNILTRSLSCLELESASLCHNPSPLPDTGQNYHILATNEKIYTLIILIETKDTASLESGKMQVLDAF